MRASAVPGAARGTCLSLEATSAEIRDARMYLGSWAGPSLDMRRNSQELPSLCTHSSNVVTGFFPEKAAAGGAAGWGSAVWRERDEGGKHKQIAKKAPAAAAGGRGWEGSPANRVPGWLFKGRGRWEAAI